MAKKKNIMKALKALEGLKEVGSFKEIADAIKKDPDLKDPLIILSRDYETFNTANKILEVYLKVLVSVLPLVEVECKLKPNEWSIRSLTMVGESIRQTISELELYSSPEDIMTEKIAPNIQFHHDEVVKDIAEQLSRTQNKLLEIVPQDKKHQAKRLLIEFLKELGENLKGVYTITLEKLNNDLSLIKGL